MGDSGITPRSLVNGWYSITPLMSALAAATQIPADLPYEEHVKGLLADTIEICSEFDRWEADERDRMEAWYNEGRRATRLKFKKGDLILLAKGNPERLTGGKLMPQADGPYEITEMKGEHNATLVHSISGEKILEGRPQTTARFVYFGFPKELIVPQPGLDKPAEYEFGSGMSEEELQNIFPGDVVAYVIEKEGEELVGLLLCEGKQEAQKMMSGKDLVAPGPGSWGQRIWQLQTDEGVERRNQISYSDLLCRIELQNNRLANGSLDALRTKGVAV